MKKVLTVLLVLSLSVMLFACASKTITAKPIIVTDPTEETTTAPTEATTEYIEEEDPFLEDDMANAEADAAISTAANALNGNGISQSALQTLLESEGYSFEAIMVAINSANADWNAQAAKAATNAMADVMSPSALKDLLITEGFTSAQADYGAANCGDWNAYALAYAQQYLSGLEAAEMEAQMVSEGFTAAQAAYAAANI